MAMHLLLVLSLMLCQHMNVQAQNSAICFLTKQPASEMIKFAQQLAQDGLQYDLDVFIMIDDNTFTTSSINTSSNFQLLQISNGECIQYGFKNAISIPLILREVTSWDKALLYFTLLRKDHSFVWLIEDDVFYSKCASISIITSTILEYR